MHMKGNICVSPRRERQALKGKTAESKNKRLNIYFGSDGSSEESDSDNEKKCLSRKSDDLHIDLEKLNISPRKSESEDEESKLDLVTKGLISEKEQRREKRVQSTRPYPNTSSHIVLSTHQNGGDVMVERIPNYVQNDMIPNIPVPVVERSRVQPFNIPVQPGPSDDIDSILSSNEIVFEEEDFHKIYNALKNQPELNDQAESSYPKSSDQICEYAESESGYATSPTYSNLSPHSSVHSPNSFHSLQSPDPRGVPKYDTRLPAEYDTDHSEYSPQDNLYREDYYKPSISKIHPGRFMQDRVQTVSSITFDFPRLMSQSQMIPQRHTLNTIMPNYKRITSPIERNKYLQPATETLVYEADLKKTAKERYLVKFNKKVVNDLWTIVASTDIKDFSSIKDDKTCLTKLLLMQELPKDFIIRVYTIVQRMTRTDISLLRHRDKNDRNALYIAALIHKKHPVVARFIADTYVHHHTQEYSPDELYANENTLLHILAGENDEYAQVLAELLHTEMRDGKTKSFKINSTNKDTFTALHIAAKKHSHLSSTLNISHLLVKHGANLAIKDKDGNTPLHIALKNHCDPIYIRALLQSTTARQCINMVDNDSNTALHLAALRNDIPFEKQREVILHLATSNAQHDIHNREGKVALALVSVERKEDIRKILQRRM